ncbi:hypothetical protein PR048_004688 [Dryococelus australis]|uniref:Uncharacterized protein n=1 Tax=Dryococelus australis TaxID=614101 RepID=A0ABQ9I637_9NEOP|nr:hypothetical protein PR048_004688 [Dryococelus australis]
MQPSTTSVQMDDVRPCLSALSCDRKFAKALSCTLISAILICNKYRDEAVAYAACSPPTKVIWVQSPAGSLGIFACGNRTGRCRWSASFLGDLPFPPSLHSGAAPYSLQSPLSVPNGESERALSPRDAKERSLQRAFIKLRHGLFVTSPPNIAATVAVDKNSLAALACANVVERAISRSSRECYKEILHCVTNTHALPGIRTQNLPHHEPAAHQPTAAWEVGDVVYNSRIYWELFIEKITYLFRSHCVHDLEVAVSVRKRDDCSREECRIGASSREGGHKDPGVSMSLSNINNVEEIEERVKMSEDCESSRSVVEKGGSQRQSSDSHKTPYDLVKCRECKINIKAFERKINGLNTRPILRLGEWRTGCFVLGRRDEDARRWTVPAAVIRLQLSAFGAMVQVKTNTFEGLSKMVFDRKDALRQEIQEISAGTARENYSCVLRRRGAKIGIDNQVVAIRGGEQSVVPAEMVLTSSGEPPKRPTASQLSATADRCCTWKNSTNVRRSPVTCLRPRDGGGRVRRRVPVTGADGRGVVGSRPGSISVSRGQRDVTARCFPQYRRRHTRTCTKNSRTGPLLASSNKRILSGYGEEPWNEMTRKKGNRRTPRKPVDLLHRPGTIPTCENQGVTPYEPSRHLPGVMSGNPGQLKYEDAWTGIQTPALQNDSSVFTTITTCSWCHSGPVGRAIPSGALVAQWIELFQVGSQWPKWDGAARPRSRSEGAIRARLTRPPSASSQGVQCFRHRDKCVLHVLMALLRVAAWHRAGDGSVCGECGDVVAGRRVTKECLYDITLASYQGEPSSISGWITGFSQVGIVPDVAVGRQVFSVISRFLHPSFRRRSILTSITLIGSHYLSVKSHPNLFTLLRFCNETSSVKILIPLL